MRLYENLKPKLSMLPRPDPDSLVEVLKRVHLRCYVRLNTAKPTLPSLHVDRYGWEVRENYNGVPMCFSVNQLPSSMANSSEADFRIKKSTKEFTNDATNS